MKVDRKALLDILNKIKPAIPKKDGDDDMLKRVIFTGTDVVAYGEHMAVAWPLEVDFATVLPSEETIAMLQKITADEIDLVYSKDQLNIKASNVKARLKTEPDSKLLEEVNTGLLTAAAEATWYMLPENFNKAVELCKYSTSKDRSQQQLTCVYVNGNQVVASDDFRISQYILPQEIISPMLIKADTCVQMGKFTFTQYAITPTWVLFLTADDVLLGSRVISTPYGDVGQFLEFEGTQYELPSALAQRVDQVAVLAKGEHDIEKEVTVTLTQGVAQVRAEKEVGWAEATAKHAKLLVGTPAAFKVNPIFLTEVLRMTNNIITLGTDKAKFQKDTFTHLISLSTIGAS